MKSKNLPRSRFPLAILPPGTRATKLKQARHPPAGVDVGKDGCAVSFIMEERGELDKLCERTPAERSESYIEPDKVKEAGGEALIGGGGTSSKRGARNRRERFVVP